LKIAFQLRKLNDYEAVAAVETLAKLTGYTAIELDQIFVNFGSGYYYGSVSQSENSASTNYQTVLSMEQNLQNHVNCTKNGVTRNSIMPEIVAEISVFMEQNGIVCGSDYDWRKRGDGAYIAEVTRSNGARKNIITIWPNRSGGGRIRIVGDEKYDEIQKFDYTKFDGEDGVCIARAVRTAYNKTK
jgi:hypothetical protein